MALDAHPCLLLRCVNERIAELAASSRWDGAEAVDFHCECGAEDCSDNVSATLQEFELAKSRGAVVVPEHAARGAASRPGSRSGSTTVRELLGA